MSESYPYPRCSVCSEDLIPDDGELCGVCARAAEERGRRAGIEERDELRALLTQFVEMANHPSYCDPLEGECSCGLSKLLDDARAALTPRDSGKEGT